MSSHASVNHLFSYEDLRKILNKIPLPMTISQITKDGSIRIVDGNDLLFERTGYTISELMTMAPEQFMTKDSVQNIRNRIEQVRLFGYGEVEATHINKDGTSFPIHLTLGLVECSNKQTYVIALLRDITYQRETEALLAMTDKQLESLFQNHPDLIFILDKYGRFTNVNPVHEKVLSISQEELISTHFLDRVVEEDIPLVKEKYRQVLNKETVRLEFRVYNNKKDIIHFDMTAIPIVRNNKMDGMICIVQDRTEEKITKMKLNENEQMYRSLFEANIDAVVTFDVDGNFMRMNLAAEKLLGYKLDEIKGSVFLKHITPDNQEKTFQYFKQALKGEAVQYETVMYNRANERRYLHVTLVPMFIDGKVIGVHSIGKDFTEYYQLQRKLNYMVFHDYLTGLANPHQFHYDLINLTESIKPEFFSLYFIDLDRFKLVNDSFGHAYGDQLLKKVARRLLAIIPSSGTVYRYGGDEFIIILRDTTMKHTKLFAEKIVKELSDPYKLDQLEIVTTPSVGISVYPSDGMDSETLIKKADNAMYHVKRLTSGHYQFYNESFKQENARNLKAYTLLHKALKQDEFFLVYQPQINAKNNQVVGVEALIRWQSEELGLLTPNEFIPLAEETGFIIPIGEWVIREACFQIQSWKKQGIVLPIAMNLSIRQFHNKEFIPALRQILKETKVDPALLHMEITESMAIDQELATEILEQLKEIGVKIAIDDFGTGYSSLNYLKKFPFDYLKIDQSFIRDLDHDEDEQDMVSIIMIIAKKFKIRTIAEGVETEKHVKLLKQVNCDIMQGYFYSKPLPANELVQWVKLWYAKF